MARNKLSRGRMGFKLLVAGIIVLGVYLGEVKGFTLIPLFVLAVLAWD